MAAILVLATLGKEFANEWYSYTHQGPAHGISDAKHQKLYLAKFRMDPPALKHGDITFEFGEAWVEARYEQSYFLVWYSASKRADWDYFCLKPMTDCYQKGVFISLTPEFSPPLEPEMNYFSERGDLWFQRVPTNLQRLRITVTAELRDSGKTVTLGTAELTRE